MSSAPNDPLFGIQSKIERTKKHIADLDAAIRTFHNTNPYKVGTYREPDTRALVYHVTHVEPVPADITQIAGDALGSMVSILDHLAFRLYLKHTPGGTGRHTYFPISKNATNATEHEAECKRKVKGIDPASVVPGLYALEAYKGGKGNQLWVLNELNNLAKHRDLIAVGSSFRSLDLGAHMMQMMRKSAPAEMAGILSQLPDIPAFYRPADPLCPLKVGDKLFIGAPDDEPNAKMQFRFDVALNEPQIVQAKPLVETVHQLLRLVDQIVDQFSRFL